MSLRYDFDIFDLNPPDGVTDAETKGFLARLGLVSGPSRPEVGSSRVALFRDQETADALRAAPDALRDYFLAAGFGLNTYASGAGRSRYPAGDEAARLEIIERLTELAPSYTLPAPADYAEGGDAFRLGAFLADLAEAMPESDKSRARHPDVAPPEAAAEFGLPPTFDTMPPPEANAAPRRKFWQGRFFLAAAAVGLAVAVLQLSASFDVINLASL